MNYEDRASLVLDLLNDWDEESLFELALYFRAERPTVGEVLGIRAAVVELIFLGKVDSAQADDVLKRIEAAAKGYDPTKVPTALEMPDLSRVEKAARFLETGEWKLIEEVREAFMEDPCSRKELALLSEQVIRLEKRGQTAKSPRLSKAWEVFEDSAYGYEPIVDACEEGSDE